MNKDTLYDYEDLAELNQARKSRLIERRNALKKQIAELKAKQQKQMRLYNLPTIDEELTKRLANIQMASSVEVKSILSKLKKEQSDLKKTLNTRTKNDNPWLNSDKELIQLTTVS